MARRGALRLGPGELGLLTEGAGQLGVKLGRLELGRFEAFAAELDFWSRRVNLISCGSAREFVARHLLDSLAAVRFVKGAQEAADLGAGAGLPGVPLAVVTRANWTLVESRRKRASFLRSVIRRLELERAVVLEARVTEAVKQPASWDVVTSRGVWGVGEFLRAATGALREGGLAVAFVGRDQCGEEVPAEFELVGTVRAVGGGRAVRAYQLRAKKCFT